MIPDESMEDRLNGIRGTNVTVCMMDGSEKQSTVLIPKGDPEKPLTTEDIILKFKTCANGLIPEKKRQSIIDYLMDFGGAEILDSDILLQR
jgi:2-methylcitrate dehydratase PrpD